MPSFPGWVRAVTITVTGPSAATTNYYVGYQSTNSGISSVNLGASTASTVTVVIQFSDPTGLGAGTYKDTLQLAVTTDAAGANPIANSPQIINVT